MSHFFRRADRRANLVMFVLAGIVSSELMWVIRSDNARADFDRQSAAQIKITRSVIERLKRGEKVDVEKELLGAANAKGEPVDDQQSVKAILQNLEAMDTHWSQASGAQSLKTPPKPQPQKQDGPEQPPENKGSSGFL